MRATGGNRINGKDMTMLVAIVGVGLFTDGALHPFPSPPKELNY